MPTSAIHAQKCLVTLKLSSREHVGIKAACTLVDDIDPGGLIHYPYCIKRQCAREHKYAQLYLYA